MQELIMINNEYFADNLTLNSGMNLTRIKPEAGKPTSGMYGR